MSTDGQGSDHKAVGACDNSESAQGARPPSLVGLAAGGRQSLYSRGVPLRNATFVGLAISAVFGAGCTIIGISMRSRSLSAGPGEYNGGNIRLNISPSFMREIFLLLLNLTFVKISLLSCGSVHETALKWKLASEKDEQTDKIRLEFNSNFRFLQSSKNWWSANGLPANVIMALCLTVSYASSSMVLLSVEEGGDHNTVVSFVALIILGIVTLLQVIIALFAILETDIITWSQSPFDTAHALVVDHRLEAEAGKCMYSLYDRLKVGPMTPHRRQKSIWASHPQFRRFVKYIWLLVGAGYYWFLIVWAMIQSGTQGAHPGTSWALIPDGNTASMNFGWNGEAPTAGLLWGLGFLVGFQGGIITTALTCSQVLAALVRDERLWREAATEKGTDPKPSLLKVTYFISWQNFAIQAADPILHWMFGLAVNVDAKAGFKICAVQILYVTVVGMLGVIVITISGRRNPSRMQPATYGHLQTLVNLVDEWHDTMFWGDKGVVPGTQIRHAGTSDHQLPEVHLGAEYGGSIPDKP
ncbi:hypothetical protein M0805_008412 [Coniferiporia weirii]|nr:hypothetical protein M0805_008412 [Coniferiporia weirii]